MLPLIKQVLTRRPNSVLSAAVCLPAGCVSKLAVGRLQRRFDALLQAGTRRLKVHELVAGV
ncbi:MAG: hypothetical protein KZQ97_02735, partial [Candidatus Thiodiazotropha sp. (ex Dulcina madagascariensis)]|nr:hypothetical protein [Candidatus Thiodiazotropha sp. (ex Dulcina madagascariensis)]